MSHLEVLVKMALDRMLEHGPTKKRKLVSKPSEEDMRDGENEHEASPEHERLRLYVFVSQGIQPGFLSRETV